MSAFPAIIAAVLTTGQREFLFFLKCKVKLFVHFSLFFLPDCSFHNNHCYSKSSSVPN